MNFIFWGASKYECNGSWAKKWHPKGITLTLLGTHCIHTFRRHFLGSGQIAFILWWTSEKMRNSFFTTVLHIIFKLLVWSLQTVAKNVIHGHVQPLHSTAVVMMWHHSKVSPSNQDVCVPVTSLEDDVTWSTDIHQHMNLVALLV